jgi:hypothetical protein
MKPGFMAVYYETVSEVIDLHLSILKPMLHAGVALKWPNPGTIFIFIGGIKFKQRFFLSRPDAFYLPRENAGAVPQGVRGEHHTWERV